MNELINSTRLALYHLDRARNVCCDLRYQQNDPIVVGKLADSENNLDKQIASLKDDTIAVGRLAGLNDFSRQGPIPSLNQE